MTSPTELRRIVEHARRFLETKLRETLDKYPDYWGDLVHKPLYEIIDEHLVPEHVLLNVTREDILSRLLKSVQNRQSANRVIGGSIVGRDFEAKWATLGMWLDDFNPEAILERWTDDENAGNEDFPDARHADEKLMAFFAARKAEGLITGALRNGKKSLWPMFAKSVISAARFVSRYPTPAAFNAWIESFTKSDDTIAALPLILSQEIYGLGLPLAADFLKELGVGDFPKPDVHIWKLARAFGISDAQTDYRLMLDLMMAARRINVTPYELDKILWLIGSGRFYRTGVSDEGFVAIEIGRQADNFIKYMATIPWKDDQVAYQNVEA